MSLFETVIFTILGGLIAGGIGYLATKVELKEARKVKHLDEHKSNLEAVSRALDEVFGEIWLFVYGWDYLKLPRPPFGNEKRVANIEIKRESIIMESPNPPSDNYPLIVPVDTVLYDDIPPHFPELSKLLDETEHYAKNNGVKILMLLNSLSALIYRKLDTCDLDFPSSNGNKTEFEKFRGLQNEGVQQDYAGSVFNMAIGENEENWPNRIRGLKYVNVYDDLKKLADEIKHDEGEMLKQLHELRNSLIRNIDGCKEEIKRIEHTTKLKGRCPYL
jgi:hypothetical protein